MESEKVALVLDTNIVEKSIKADSDFKVFKISLYDDVVDLIEKYDLVEKVCIFVPEIVFIELVKHEKDKLFTKISILKQLSEELNSLGNIKIQCDECFDVALHVDKIKSEKEKQIKLIPIPKDKGQLFERILSMAVDKDAPFEKGRSDNGFKDAIILLSVIEFAKKSDYSKVVLFTQDGAFSKQQPTIKKYFEKESGKSLEIETTKDIQGYISSKYNLFVEFKKYLNEQYYPKLLEEMNNESIIILENKAYEITGVSIDYDETTMVELSENEFELNVAFVIAYEDEDDEEDYVKDARKVIAFTKKEKEWQAREKIFNYKLQ